MRFGPGRGTSGSLASGATTKAISVSMQKNAGKIRRQRCQAKAMSECVRSQLAEMRNPLMAKNPNTQRRPVWKSPLVHT